MKNTPAPDKNTGASDLIFIKFLQIIEWLFHPLFIFTNKLFSGTRLNWLILDIAILPFTILSIPTYLLGVSGKKIRRKINAYSHIHFVCKSCPKERRNLRDPFGEGACLWNANWHAGNYGIPENFGFNNWIKQYSFQPTELDNYTSYILPIANQPIKPPHKNTFRAISSLFTWVIILTLLLAGTRVEYLYKRAETGDQSMWIDLGEVPEASNKYPPQGMTYWDGKIIFSNHWQDTKSQVYLIEPETMDILDEFKMPQEAVHISGLTFDGEWLWAADYKSNHIYQISINNSFQSGDAVVENKYKTGLDGTSAITYIQYEKHKLLAISDFLHTGKTYLIELNKTYLLNEGENIPSIATHSYHHGWFSQGLTWDGNYLFESVNNMGTDRIEVLDIKSWIDGKTTKPCVLTSFSFAGVASEDLANDGISIWGSDEKSYKFYKITNYQEKILDGQECF